MKVRNIIAAAVAASSLLAAWGTASAAPYVLVAWHQRSNSGALSALFFKSGTAQGCPAAAPFRQPCLNPSNPTGWVSSTGIATTIQSSGLATWDWDSTTSTMTGTGLLWAASFISSNANGTPVISDKVTNLVINAGSDTTSASTYECVEGTFLATVNANGCLNIDLGVNASLDSSAVYNIGGNADCVDRTVGGDDVDTSVGNATRGVTNAAAGGGCDATDGAFVQWNVIPNTRFVVLSNVTTITNDGCYMFGRGSQLATSPCANDVALSGASYMIFAPAVDTDSDGIVDAIDNCRLVANASQVDSNGDGYGNRCDGDLNNNGSTNAQDTTLYRQQLGQPSVAPTYNAADINSNGAVNAQDTTLFRTLLGAQPGPSGQCLNTYPCPTNP